MAYEIPVQLISLKAGEDLSTAQFSPVKLNSNGDIVKATAATDIVIGVLQDNPALGQMGSVMTFGVTKVKVYGQVTYGNLLTAYTGLARAASSGNKVFGIALTSASGTGEIISALVLPGLYAI